MCAVLSPSSLNHEINEHLFRVGITVSSAMIKVVLLTAL